MQTLEIISVNLWQILISLLNLLILFLIIKYFLFGPVKKMLAARQQEIDDQYARAAQAEAEAADSRRSWEEKLSGADREADAILQSATENAKYRGEQIVADARAQADSLIRVAQTEVELERRRAEDEIKREIVEVSEALAEKMLEREINKEDHRAIIDSFIEEIGDSRE